MIATHRAVVVLCLALCGCRTGGTDIGRYLSGRLADGSSGGPECYVGNFTAPPDSVTAASAGRGRQWLVLDSRFAGPDTTGFRAAYLVTAAGKNDASHGGWQQYDGVLVVHQTWFTYSRHWELTREATRLTGPGRYEGHVQLRDAAGRVRRPPSDEYPVLAERVSCREVP